MEILNSLDRNVLLHCCIQIVNYIISSLRLKVINVTEFFKKFILMMKLMSFKFASII